MPRKGAMRQFSFGAGKRPPSTATNKARPSAEERVHENETKSETAVSEPEKSIFPASPLRPGQRKTYSDKTPSGSGR